MSKIKSKNTKPETLVFRYLESQGLRFQRHYQHALGNIDIALPKKKIAVFIDGDFWHGKNYNERKLQLNKYWVNESRKEVWEILRESHVKVR